MAQISKYHEGKRKFCFTHDKDSVTFLLNILDIIVL